jgi:hypothetical protein
MHKNASDGIRTHDVSITPKTVHASDCMASGNGEVNMGKEMPLANKQQKGKKLYSVMFAKTHDVKRTLQVERTIIK